MPTGLPWIAPVSRAGALVAPLLGLLLGLGMALGAAPAASAPAPSPTGPTAPGPLPVGIPVPPARPPGHPPALAECGPYHCLQVGGWVYLLPRPPARPAGAPDLLAARAEAILRHAAALGVPAPPVLRLPAAREPGLHIVIHKGTNRLYLLEGGRVLAAFPVGTGRSQQLTPEGRFRVAIKGVLPAWRRPDGTIVPGGVPENPLGARWIGLAVRPRDGGLKYGIHGTNAPESVGGYVSAGCVRMRNEDVIWLFARVPVGTWVYIER